MSNACSGIAVVIAPRHALAFSSRTPRKPAPSCLTRSRSSASRSIGSSRSASLYTHHPQSCRWKVSHHRSTRNIPQHRRRTMAAIVVVIFSNTRSCSSQYSCCIPALVSWPDGESSLPVITRHRSHAPVPYRRPCRTRAADCAPTASYCPRVASDNPTPRSHIACFVGIAFAVTSL